jgi:hypothetical protein
MGMNHTGVIHRHRDQQPDLRAALADLARLGEDEADQRADETAADVRLPSDVGVWLLVAVAVGLLALLAVPLAIYR